MARTNRALNSAANVAEKTVVGLVRWATTDHINKGRSIQFIPGMTFLGSLWNIFMELFFGIFAAVLTGDCSWHRLAH